MNNLEEVLKKLGAEPSYCIHPPEQLDGRYILKRVHWRDDPKNLELHESSRVLLIHEIQLALKEKGFHSYVYITSANGQVNIAFFGQTTFQGPTELGAWIAATELLGEVDQ